MSIFKRWRKRAPIIIVSGLPRSGTSLMMQMLVAGGVPALTDAHRPADASNPRGYYEYEPTKRLHMGDKDWIGQARGRVVKVISHQLKHLPENEHYHIVFMRRHIGEVVASQSDMLARLDTLPVSWDAQKLLREYEQHIIYMTRWLEKQNHLRVIFIPHAELVKGTPKQIQQHSQHIADFVGEALKTPLNAHAMQDAIDPRLYHHRAER
jgi:hypothetical protein